MFSGYCEVTGEACGLNERDAQVQEVLSPGQRCIRLSTSKMARSIAADP